MTCQLKKKQLNVRSALDSVCKCVIIIFRVEIIKHSVLIVWKYNDQLGIYVIILYYRIGTKPFNLSSTCIFRLLMAIN